MSSLSGGDMAILAVAAYVAISSLVRLMQQRHDQVVMRLQAEVAIQQRLKRTSESHARRQERQQAARQVRESRRPAA